jgi:YHS domain-containing protein
MSGWATLLLFAGFFYLMMRFGCGAHMVHGGHGGHTGMGTQGGASTEYTCPMHPEVRQSGPGTCPKCGMTLEPVAAAPAPPKKDPVCGMVVEPGQGYTENHDGKEYRFCSRKCLDKFDAEPQRYIS